MLVRASRPAASSANCSAFLLELCLALAEHWRLPDWIIQGYRLLGADRRRLIKALHIAHDNEHPLHQQQMLDADPELRRWLTLPSNTIVLANGLALSAHHSWSGIHSLRWQRLAGLYLQVPLGNCSRWCTSRQSSAPAISARPISGTPPKGCCGRVAAASRCCAKYPRPHLLRRPI